MEVLATAVREEKEIKEIQIAKDEIKLSLFADDGILYIENPTDATKKLQKFINKLKDKNHMIISIDAEKAFDKFNIHL